MKFTVAGLLALGSIATASHAAVITFEETGIAPAAMLNSPGAAVPVASRLTDQYLGLGALFTSQGGFAAVVNHSPNPSATPSPPAVIGGTLADGTLSYTAPITITFVKPGDSSTLGTTTMVRILGDWFPLNSGTITMSAFGIDGTLLGSDTEFDNGSIGQGAALQLDFAQGIHRVVISGTSGTVGFDNLEFGPVSPVSASIPEPTVVSLLLISLFMASAISRRPINS
ncbi:hypothetical protein [Rubrivivax rivuli]|uniref:PEP-CTERM sorting domain-containing protein n=1 Tax=Rubrivivax rivuli TaxID=1862385 RepID=A0A437RJW5_9BURK|nr:hypothetical protein [Rubrivivax rivuli]RVU47073.1 hypothetical protein EOE66_04715 [Rubrivivax rivuli]